MTEHRLGWNTCLRLQANTALEAWVIRALARPQNCRQLKRLGVSGSMMRVLKPIFTLAALAVIVGQGVIERQSARNPGNVDLPHSFNSEPVQVLVRACGNCHSDRTDWPWYSHVPPVSWWIARHVREGRNMLDFSEWQSYSEQQRLDKAESICGLVSIGRMPPRPYTAIHPEARLSETEKKAVCAWAQEVTIGVR